MEEFKGYVEHIIYRNEENTYTVFEVQCEDGLVTCTGFPPAISEGSYRERKCSTRSTASSSRWIPTG